MYWKSVTKDRYDKVLKIVPWEVDLPKGAQFHVAAFTDDGMHVTAIRRCRYPVPGGRCHRAGTQAVHARFHAKEVVHKIALSPRDGRTSGAL